MAQRALSKRRLDNLFLYHLVVSTAIGIFTFLAPHSLAVVFAGEGHALHEFVRLYGALSLAQSWLVWKTRSVSDAVVRKTFCQAYALTFGLQALTLLRAEWTAPEQHSFLTWICILIFASLSAGYAYFLYFEPLKAFASLDREDN